MIILITVDLIDFYGPFVSEQAAINYAKDHGITKYKLRALRDSGECLEYQDSEQDNAKT